MAIQEPWTRVRQPVDIPATYKAADLVDLSESDFAQLIRSHLVPRDQSPAGRRAWEQLWRTIAQHDQLSERTYDVIEDFLDATEMAIDTGNLDTAATQRAEKFRQQCDHAWNRLERDHSGHLAWAGKAGDFQPSAQRVIATLVGAIARHRGSNRRSGARESAADQRLWAALRQVDLDPDDYR